MKTANCEINTYTNCEHCGATLAEGEDCICKPEFPDNGFVEYGRKLETIGKLMQNPNTKIDQLVFACNVAGLDICFSITEK